MHGAPPPALPGLLLPQARLPQPTVFDGTTPPFQESIQETRNFLSINNYDIRTTDGATHYKQMQRSHYEMSQNLLLEVENDEKH